MPLRKVKLEWHILTPTEQRGGASMHGYRYNYRGHHIVEALVRIGGEIKEPFGVRLFLTTDELFNIPPAADLLEAAKLVLAGGDPVALDELRAAVAVAEGEAEA